MDKNLKTGLIYGQDYEVVKDMTNEEAGQLYKAMLYFVLYKDDSIDIIQDKFVAGYYSSIKQRLKYNQQKYDEKCERNRQNALKKNKKNQNINITNHKIYTDDELDNIIANEPEQDFGGGCDI